MRWLAPGPPPWAEPESGAGSPGRTALAERSEEAEVVDGPSYTAAEMMAVASARTLRDGAVCFVGTGLPLEVALLARRLHAPNLVLVHESGVIDARPESPSCQETAGPVDPALTTVGLPELFSYWLQAGRLDVGVLSAAQLDRFGNINNTVLGDYFEPDERLAGAGAAPEVAAHCGEVLLVLPHRLPAFVDGLDFVTAVGHGNGPGDRERLGLPGRGPTRVVTDLGVLEPDPVTRELMLTGLHPGVSVARVRAETGWELQLGGSPDAEVLRTPAPTVQELDVLRQLRTVRA